MKLFHPQPQTHAHTDTRMRACLAVRLSEYRSLCVSVCAASHAEIEYAACRGLSKAGSAEVHGFKFLGNFNKIYSYKTCCCKDIDRALVNKKKMIRALSQ